MTLAKMIGVAAMIAILFAYISSYAYLSRHGMSETRAYNSEGILYVPVSEVEQSHNLSRHHLLRVLFTPLNLIDQKVLGADAPVTSMMFDLS